MKIFEIINEDVWHGTPHKFDKFQLDKIGTGEGAQAYGYGLYFTSQRKIAEYYRHVLSVDKDQTGWTYKSRKLPKSSTGLNSVFVGYDGYPDEFKVAGYLIAFCTGSKLSKTTVNMALKNVDKAIASVVERMTKYSGPASLVDRFKKDDDELIEKYKMVANILTSIDLKNFEYKGGNLYHVEIPEENEYLDWDLKLYQQPDNIKHAVHQLRDLFKPNLDARNERREALNKSSPGRLTNALLKDIATKEITVDDLRGAEIYEILCAKLPGRDMAASSKLHSLGIAGIKYIGDTSSVRNYVVFTDDRIKIKKRM